MNSQIVSIIVWLQVISVLCVRIPVSRNEQAVEDPTELHYRLPLKFNIHYTGQVTVGKPEKVFTVIFDSGSVESWFTSPKCTKCARQSTSRTFSFYDSTRSTSYKPGEQEEWSIQYQDGLEVKGKKVVQDQVKIGSGPNALLVRQLVFGEVEDFHDKHLLGDNVTIFEGCDGMIGLGLVTPNNLPGSPDPLFFSLVKQNNIQPVFGLHLTSNGFQQPNAEFVFGGHDEDLVETAFSYHPVIKRDYEYRGWLIDFNGVKVRGQTMVRGRMLATIDTGAKAIHSSEKNMANINRAIFQRATFSFKENYFFSCNEDLSSLPDVTLTMGSQDFLLKPKDYIKITTGSSCRTRFIGVKGLEDNEFIIGTVFMEAYYTRFNFGKQQVEFARLKQKNV